MARHRTVKSVLVAALHKLEKYGWIKEDSGSRKRGYCLTGAINASTKNEGLREQAIDALYASLTPAVQVSVFGEGLSNRSRVQDYNDDYAKRKRSIIALYHRAIKRVSV